MTDEDLIFELQEKIKSLEAQLAPVTLRDTLYDAFGLTPSEALILATLYTRSPNVAHKEHIWSALYGDKIDADRPSGPKIIDVLVCKIRFKLRPFGLRFETSWGRGWFLTPAQKAEIDAYLASHEITPRGSNDARLSR